MQAVKFLLPVYLLAKFDTMQLIFPGAVSTGNSIYNAYVIEVISN